MASLSNSHPTSARGGFTLFEVVIVMAFIAVVGGFSMFMSMDTYRGYNFHTERDLAIAALQHARAQAIGNICNGAGCATGKPHGVSIQADKFVIFQGSSYAARDVSQDATIPANSTVAHSGQTEIVFAQLSGNVGVPGSITFSDPGRSSNITVGAQGQIFWDK